MQMAIDAFFSDHVTDFTRQLAGFESRLTSHETPDSEDVLREVTTCIDDSLAACNALERELASDPQLLKSVQARYREAIAPWFSKSWFMDRSLSKPRGYPGDYFLLSSIYDRKAKSTGFAGYLDRYLLNSTLAKAVLSRMWAAREFLQDEVARRDGKVSILNVACGSCREYLGGFLEDASSGVQLTCVDNDTEALDHVRAEIAPHLPATVDVTFTRYNALRMTSSKANVEHFGRNDIIYSVGLCDYIPDEYLIPMLRGWRESLAEGGVVFVAFKDTELYDKSFYQWPLDWYFYQRTFEDCRNLFLEAGYDMEQMEVTRCDMPVIVNFIGRAGVRSTIRIDDAESMPTAHHMHASARSERIAEEAGS